MKSVAAFIFLSLAIICGNNDAVAQLWKQYADSAKALSEQQKINEAIEMYSRSKDELVKDSQGTMSYAEVCNSLAVLFDLGAGQYKKAEPLYLEALQIAEKIKGKESPVYAEWCNDLGNLYRTMGENQKAEPLLLDALKIREKILGKEHADYAASCNDLGLFYMGNEKYKQAEPLLLDARRIWGNTLGKEHAKYAKSCNNLALLYARMNQLDKAETFITEARQIFLKAFGNMDPNYAGATSNLAAIYLRRDQYEKAEPLMIESLEIVETTRGKEHPDYARGCINLGMLYMNMNQYQKAAPFLVEAKTKMEQVFGNQHLDYVRTCEILAGLYGEMGMYEKAEPLFLEMKQTLSKLKGNEDAEYANSCRRLAELYRLMGQFQKAEALGLESKKIIEKAQGKESLNYALSCQSLGALYERTGQLEKAISFELEAQNTILKTSGKENRDYASGCSGLAGLYRRMNQYEKAESLFLEAKEIWEKVAGINNSGYAMIIHNFGRLYQAMHQYQKAEPLLLQAKDIREKRLGKSHADYMASCSRLGNLYWNMQENEKAKRLYAEAYELEIASTRKVFDFTSEIEKQRYIKEIANLDQFYLSFLTSVYPQSDHGVTYDVCLSSRNLILNSSRQFRYLMRTSSDSAVRRKYDEWLYLKERLSFWYAKPAARRPAYVNDFESQANNLEKELTSMSSAFKTEHLKKTISWTDIQQSLKPNEAAIEFVKFKFFNGYRMTDSILYFAVLLRKDRAAPQLVPLFENKELSAILRNGNTTNTIAAIYHDNHSYSAYNLIWSPLEKHLENITKIYFAPSGQLYRICFAAIPIDGNHVLGDKYELVQLNTTASIVSQEEQLIATSDKILLFGGIKYDADSTNLKQATSAFHNKKNTDDTALFAYSDDARGNTWKYLPGTEREIKAIQSIGKQMNYSVTLSLGAMATEEKFKELNGSSLSVLHIATHGFFFPDMKKDKENTESSETEKVLRQAENPLLRSGLLFAGANHAWKGRPIEGIENGIVTAFEISDMSLPQTKLVVLSACETGLGDIQGNEGVYGLQRAFKIAGVENLVMSLWKVPDNTTAEFMQEFYKSIFNKQSVNKAFYNAQTTMKNKYRKEPFKWAAWILVR